VDATNFLTASSASVEAFKTANLLKGLGVNAVIFGERGTGKLTLARYILPHAPVIDAGRFEELLDALESKSDVIIYHLDNIPNLKRLIETVQKTRTRVIATAGGRYSQDQLDEIFTIRMALPPLSERHEDVDPLIDVFVSEARRTLGKSEPFDFEGFVPDLSENALSLRRQVYLRYLFDTINENDLMGLMEHFLMERLGSNNDYRNFLHLYEVPLIRAGIKRFKSQLQLSERLGLNRNTLRKKINEHAHYQLELKEL
jgi:DNA-binding NtrC family response regulator